jgi:hypothetical protein
MNLFAHTIVVNEATFHISSQWSENALIGKCLSTRISHVADSHGSRLRKTTAAIGM